MKKLVLFLLVTGLFGGSFEHNTDKKDYYKFDSDVRDKNDKLQKTLERFEQGRVSKSELKKYIDKKTFSKEKYGKDVIILYTKEQKKVVKPTETNSSKSWYNIF